MPTSPASSTTSPPSSTSPAYVPRALLSLHIRQPRSALANPSSRWHGQVNDPPVRNSQEAFQMEMRAARMVHSADSLLKLVSELKRTAIFSGLASLNENVDRRIEVLGQQAEGTERMLERIGQEAAASLKELEAHYYSSVVRSPSYD
ncbi:hypothetical protein PVAP13_5KG114600 [Panicum virgatum]|uniref:Surfeit locus protein 5 n=1 Tax=Panicum virgatum TaxID=38727 RepID=A0A8T0SC81_PANVG|nr:hypothetical protein PVAP13_5KG114600 [Panicum virgatum]